MENPYPFVKFWDPLGGRAPQQNFTKFDPDIFPEIKTSYNFVNRQSFDPPTVPEILKKINVPEIEKIKF